MNNFKEIAKLVRRYKEKNNALYEFLDKEDLGEYFRSLVSLSELKEDKTTMLAILRRLVDLKEENLIQEWKKNNLKEDKIIELKHKFYEEVRKFYEKEHQDLINEIKEKKLLNNFYQSLLQGVHNIGLIMDIFEISWTKEIIEKIIKFYLCNFRI